MRTYEELVKEAIQKAHEEAAAKAAAAKEEVKRFEVGATYQTRSICNHDCIFTIKVIKRTDKTVVVEEDGKQTRCKIHNISGEETIFPHGRYSMCPVFHAGRKAA